MKKKQLFNHYITFCIFYTEDELFQKGLVFKRDDYNGLMYDKGNSDSFISEQYIGGSRFSNESVEDLKKRIFIRPWWAVKNCYTLEDNPEYFI